MKKIILIFFIATSLFGQTEKTGVNLNKVERWELLDSINNTKEYAKNMIGDSLNSAGLIYGTNGKKYQIISGVIRNTGSGWEMITTGGHTPTGIDSIENFTEYIKLHYNFTGISTGTLLCAPDEEFAKLGYSFGASVGVTNAVIWAGFNDAKDIYSYITYDGTSWTHTGTDVTSVTFANGVLTINHVSVLGYGFSVSSRDGAYVMGVGSSGSELTQVYIRDYAGALVTSPATDMKLYFMKGQNQGFRKKNMSEIVSASANIWVFGMMEVE